MAVEKHEQTLYQVEIRERGGSTRRFRIWAKNRELACASVMLFPGEQIRVEEAALWWSWIERNRKNRQLRPAEQWIVLDTLQVAMSFGLPLDKALSRVSTKLTHPAVLGAIAVVSHAVTRQGWSLSRALRESSAFPEDLVNMITAGEDAGQLSGVLKLLVARLAAHRSLVRRVVASAAYPLLLLGMGILALFGIGTLILPQMEQVFLDARYDLPLVTHWVLQLAKWMYHPLAWVTTGMVFLSGGWGFRRFWRSCAGIGWLSRIPQLGGLLSGLILLKPLQALHILLHAGQPLIMGVQAASRVCRHPVYAEYFSAMGQGLSEGKTLEQLLQLQRRDIPEGVELALFLGDVADTGRLADPLAKFIDNLEETLDLRSRTLPKILEPVLLSLVFGLILIVVVAAVLPGLEFLRQSISEM